MNNKKTIIIFVGILIGMSNSMIMQTILTTSLPLISSEFGTVEYYSWVYSGYMLASTVTIPLFGKICDKFGYRKNYLIGSIFFFIGTLGCGMCGSMKALVAYRIIMGIGAGIIVPATYGILGVIFKKEQMTKVFAFIAVFQIITNGIGSYLGGVFTTSISWRYGMYLLIPIEIIGFIIICIMIDNKSSGKNDSSLDTKGAVFFTVSILFIMYGLEKCSNSFLNKNIVFLIIGLVLLAVCLYFDNKKEDGILPCEVKESRTLRSLLIQVMLLGGILNICLAYLPTYMVRELGLDTNISSRFLIIYLVTMGLSSLLSAYLSKQNRNLILYGWTSVVLGTLSGFLSFLIYTSAFFIIAIILLGIGVGILSATVMGSMQAEIKNNRASANGIAHLIRNFGGTIGVAALQICLLKGMKIFFISIFIIGIIALCLQIKISTKSLNKEEEQL